MTKLPEWLEAELPEMREVNYIDYDPMTQLFTYKGKEFDTVVAAYDFAGRDDTVDFSVTVQKMINNEKLGSSGIYTVKSARNAHSGRILLVHTDEKSRGYLEMIYQQWLETNDAYQTDPEDWVIAYQWISQHPAFWTRDKDEKTWDWNTDRGTKIYTEVFYHKGKAKVGFETGGHTPGYTDTYHDYELDVYAPTFEEAYVKLAKRINKFFAPDGSERPGVREALDSDDEV